VDAPPVAWRLEYRDYSKDIGAVRRRPFNAEVRRPARRLSAALHPFRQNPVR
jgi:hypothetical protein